MSVCRFHDKNCNANSGPKQIRVSDFALLKNYWGGKSPENIIKVTNAPNIRYVII